MHFFGGEYFFLDSIFFIQFFIATYSFTQSTVCAGYIVNICHADQIQLGCNTAIEGKSYSWQPQAGLTCAKYRNLLASPPTTAEYILIVTDSLERTATDMALDTNKTDPKLITSEITNINFKQCTDEPFDLQVWDASVTTGIEINPHRIDWGNGSDNYSLNTPQNILNHNYITDNNIVNQYFIDCGSFDD